MSRASATLVIYASKPLAKDELRIGQDASH